MLEVVVDALLAAEVGLALLLVDSVDEVRVGEGLGTLQHAAQRVLGVAVGDELQLLPCEGEL